MEGYTILTLGRNALIYHENLQEAWRSPRPRSEYDVVIVGGGGHGLATAYYLAKEHGIWNVAVLERGWLGGGNTGRNTTIVRSNYLYPESARLYDFSLRLYEQLSRDSSSGAPAPRATTRWPGATRARRTRSGSTSSRTARSRAFSRAPGDAWS